MECGMQIADVRIEKQEGSVSQIRNPQSAAPQFSKGVAYAPHCFCLCVAMARQQCRSKGNNVERIGLVVWARVLPCICRFIEQD
jgi:hypothetical protein